MIRNIIWDVDGSLFDTFPAITYALSKSLNRMGKPVALNTIDGLVRQSFWHCLSTLSKRYKVDSDVLQCMFDSIYQAVPLQNQPVVNGANEVCRWVKNEGGFNIAICDRPACPAAQLLEMHGMSDDFAQPLFCADPAAADPGRGLAGDVVAWFSVEPGETLVVAQRSCLLQAAHQAGCLVCSPGQDGLQEYADICVENYQQLLQALKDQAK